ncbi:PQQ-binding-like beta-propeller repeat protein [Aestuariispira insulae]|uniref:Outer membrane protein assembly factor BamB n=1 Tax=Aestuariispira insulae TaxID=1461337 RepID=A0A3D9HVN3_9PROT|nr:PQQ-binding-like beta-propeller repeat protein [Aestuariispira insulae]RED53574.1 putative pyrroloquinoline-quinone binding quinoprotein [Aestuariispira insulae]
MRMSIRTLSRNALTLSLAGGILAGCSWFGEDEAPPLPGDRVSIILLESDLEPDPRLADLEVRLPKPYVNKDWPQYGGYSDHAMHHLQAGDALTEAWSVSIGDGGDDENRLLNAPVISNGRIFTVDIDYEVRAHDVETGRLLWSREIEIPDEDDDAFGGGLAVDGDRLFLSTGYARVIAMSTENGQEIWRKIASGPIRSAPAVSKDIVLVTAVDNQSTAYSASTGEKLWTHTGFAESAGLIGGSSPAIHNSMAYIPYSSGELFALRLTNGRVAWSGSLASLRRVDTLSSLADIRGGPVVDRGVVFAISHAGRMAAFDQKSGARVWDRRIGGINTPWVAGNFVFVLASDGHLAALTRRGGRVRWLSSLPIWEDPEDREDPINWVGPVLVGDRLLLGNSIGELWTFSPYDGSALGREDVGDAIRVPPVVADGKIFIQTDGGRLIAFK